MKHQRKTVLVTGGAVRIGKAICEALAEAGYNVVIHCRRSAKAAGRLASQLKGRGVRAWVVTQDLGDEASCEGLIREAFEVAGRVDVLVNNAAIFHKFNLDETMEDELRQEFTVNCFVPVMLTKHFARRARRGCVVNMLDRRIRANDTGCLAYSLSKKAVAAFTAEAALALAPTIRVNAVAPGPILPPPGMGMSVLHDRAGRIPMEKRVMPSEVAGAVVALIAMESVTGQILFVDGGQHLLGNV